MNGLTSPEKKFLEKSKLERLIVNGMAALHTGNADEIQAARQALQFFRDQITSLLSLQNRADKAIAALNADQVDQGREKLGYLIVGLGDHGNVLAAARAIAESGKESLLFPRLAATASSALELVKEFKKTAKSLSASVGDASDLSDILEILDTVTNSLGALKDKANALSV